MNFIFFRNLLSNPSLARELESLFRGENPHIIVNGKIKFIQSTTLLFSIEDRNAFTQKWIKDNL